MISIPIWAYTIVVISVFLLGRYNGQRNSEKINDTIKKIVLGICDTVNTAQWLTPIQKEKLADSIIKDLPWKDQKKINEQMEAMLKTLGLSK